MIKLLNLYNYDKDLEIPKLVNKECIDEQKLEEFRKNEANYLDQFYYVFDCAKDKQQIINKIIEKGNIRTNDMLELLINIESYRNSNKVYLIKKYVNVPKEYLDAYAETCSPKCILSCMYNKKIIDICPNSFVDYGQDKCYINNQLVDKKNIAMNDDECTYKIK